MNIQENFFSILCEKPTIDIDEKLKIMEFVKKQISKDWIFNDDEIYGKM